MEPKSLILVALVVFILGALVFLRFRKRRK